MGNLTNDGETYFKRGARIKRPVRVRLVEAIKPPPENPLRDESYKLSMAHLHKPWARRWLKSNGYHL